MSANRQAHRRKTPPPNELPLGTQSSSEVWVGGEGLGCQTRVAYHKPLKNAETRFKLIFSLALGTHRLFWSYAWESSHVIVTEESREQRVGWEEGSVHQCWTFEDPSLGSLTAQPPSKALGVGRGWGPGSVLMQTCTFVRLAKGSHSLCSFS